MLLHCKVKYPSGVTVNLGNKVTPTQAKDVPKVTWDAEQMRLLYTVLGRSGCTVSSESSG